MFLYKTTSVAWPKKNFKPIFERIVENASLLKINIIESYKGLGWKGLLKVI